MKKSVLILIICVISVPKYSSANQWEMNEKKVNDMWLYLYRNPLDAVDSNIVYDLQALASSCPFVEGLAVYRARALWSLWEPNAVFDDRLLCIQGQNKNQDNNNIDIDSLLESQIVNSNGTRQNSIGRQNSIFTNKVDKGGLETSIKIYPNPSNNFIIIEYHSTTDGAIRLFNTLGEIVLNTTLSKDNTKTQLMLNDIANGLYHYEIEFASMKKTIGKLTILK